MGGSPLAIWDGTTNSSVEDEIGDKRTGYCRRIHLILNAGGKFLL